MSETAGSGRNYGIDLLRIVSMWLVCVNHVLGNGGIISSSGFLSINYDVSTLLQVAALCAVNCYALISGYVGVNSRYKISNLAYLWCQVLFYSVLITAAFAIIDSSLLGEGVGKAIGMSFLPVTTGKYWYFSAYFGLFLFMPLLNFAVNNMPRVYLKWVLIIICAVVSVFTVVNGNLFQINEGYSALWLMLLYTIGGYMRKYEVFAKRRTLTLVSYILISVLITWLVKIVFDIIVGKTESDVPVWEQSYAYGYTAPTVILISIVMLRLFSGVSFKKKPRVIIFFSQVSFGVYLIHEHPLIRVNVVAKLFGVISSFNVVLMALSVIGAACAIFLVCSAIDYVRLVLFKLIKVKPALLRLENYCKYKIIRLGENKNNFQQR